MKYFKFYYKILIQYVKQFFDFLFLLYLKLTCVNLKIGNNVHIEYPTLINIGKNTLILGDNVFLRSRSKGYHGGMPFPATILIDKEDAFVKIGNKSRLNGCYLHAEKGITIGENCVIAAGVNILDSNGHLVNSFDRTVGRDEPSAIVIEDNVWIGIGAVILKGTRLGSNSVVGAGSVVKGVFPMNVIIQGNPAIIRSTIKLNEN